MVPKESTRPVGDRYITGFFSKSDVMWGWGRVCRGSIVDTQYAIKSPKIPPTSSTTAQPSDAVDLYQPKTIASLQDNSDVQDQGNRTPAPAYMIPKLTRPDYYCKPSIEKLRTFTVEQLQTVQNFEVGKVGFGSLFWPGVTDLTGVDLDEAVEIGKMTCSVRICQGSFLGGGGRSRVDVCSYKSAS